MRKPCGGAQMNACAIAIAAVAVFVAACGSGIGGGVKATPPPPGFSGCLPAGQSVEALSQNYARRMPMRAPQEKYIRNRIAVRFVATGAEPEVALALTRLGAQRIAPPNDEGWVAVSIAPGSNPLAAAAAMKQTRGVADAKAIAARYPLVFPDDPYLGSRSQLTAPQPTPGAPAVQWDMFATNMDQVWPNWTGAGVTIAIIDTGYDALNVDVCGKVTKSAVFDFTTGVQDTGSTAQDESGHGTDVSGIAASATNNNLRYSGVGIAVNLLEVRVFAQPSALDPNPGASDADIGAGINWAVAHGANVISMSLGAPAPCDASAANEKAAIQNAINPPHNVTVVIASGNENSPSLDVPANCDSRIVSVGASGIDDVTNPAAPFEAVALYSSGTLANGLTLVAPGGDPCLGTKPPNPNCTPPATTDYLQWITNAWSTTANSFGVPPNPGPGVGIFIAGTSMATPHVAAVAALLLQKHPGWQPGQVKSALIMSAHDICSFCAREGNGRLDAFGALQL